MTFREQMNIVVVGHVDHGKSTVIGRLLADTGSLPEGKLDQVRAQCERNARPFEYAFLLDALKDEQSQGITIDTARCFFKTKKRDYIIIDAPGHIEFLKNMVSGAARAEAALLVIDAHEGIAENSKRHGYLVSMLGISQLVILVNKMDLISHDQTSYDSLVREYSIFLEKLGISPLAFIPVSARNGDNIAQNSDSIKWYDGPPVLDLIDGLEKKPEDERKPLRFPVQDIYKFTEAGDDRRIIAGTVESGTISVGDKVIFHPSGKRSEIKSIEAFNVPTEKRVSTGQAAGFTLKDQLYLKAGEIMCKADQQQPLVATQFRANVFWMANAPLVKNTKYKLKLGTARAQVRLLDVVSCIDATELTSISGKQQVDRHDVAECVFECVKPIAFDPVTDIEATGRFVIIDNFDIAGGGIVAGAVGEEQAWLGQHVQSRETLWEKSRITSGTRAARNGHRGKAIVICGDQHRKEIAHELEAALFSAQYQSYYSGIENIRAGLDAELDDCDLYATERIFHLGELARILTDAGLIFITTIDNVDASDIQALRKLNEPYEMLVLWSGDQTPPSGVDRTFDSSQDPSKCVTDILDSLRLEEVIPDYSI